MKSAGALQQKMRVAARTLLFGLLLAMAIVSLWTPLTHPAIATRWFSFPISGFLRPFRCWY
jgi:cytochrome d ubiquinol oxidase subunit II